MTEISGPVAVVGVGRMGSHIAFEYALAGFDVTCASRDMDGVRRRCREAAELARDATGRSREEIDAATGRLTFVPGRDLERITAPAMVIESLPEDLQLKADVIGPLAARWKTSVIASNTSSIRITDLGTAIGAAERTVGTHYLNPALLMAPVEVISGDHTHPAIRDAVASTLRHIGKEPVLVQRDVPGFIWNRLQFALLREAVDLVDRGVASLDDVDHAVRAGLARRWVAAGPIRTAAMGGIETFEAAARHILPDLSGRGDIDTLREIVQNIDKSELAVLEERRNASLGLSKAMSPDALG